MEEKENNEKKEETSKKEQVDEKEKKDVEQKDQNSNIYDQYKLEKENSPEKLQKVQEMGTTSNPQVINNTENEPNTKEEIKEGQPQEKVKRHRRGKNEINDRKYICPDCDKCYLSGPALTTHRKTKHGYGNEGEKSKRRGRPKKEGATEEGQNALNKFNNFFNHENRKKNNNILQVDKENKESEEEKEVELSKIKDILTKIFNQCKEQLFKEIENIDKYSFYNLIIENWEKAKEALFPEDEKFCYNAQFRKGDTLSKLNSYNLDQLFFIYLKEFSKKVNDDYLWFMFKFVVLFRECINLKNEGAVTPEIKTEKRQVYTQIFNAEKVPEICNYFFLDFLQPYDNFGLNKEELIELIQNFCYWLYINKYAQSHLTLIED